MDEAAGTVVHAFDLEGGDLGAVHVPLPVLVGDILAFDEGPPQEVVSVFRDPDGRPVRVTVRPVVFLPRP
jgi:hypothetical protein